MKLLYFVPMEIKEFDGISKKNIVPSSSIKKIRSRSRDLL